MQLSKRLKKGEFKLRKWIAMPKTVLQTTSRFHRQVPLVFKKSHVRAILIALKKTNSFPYFYCPKYKKKGLKFLFLFTIQDTTKGICVCRG